MKNKFLLTCALLGVLTMSGCKNKEDVVKTTLSAPEAIEVKVDSNGRSYIIFDEVAGAEYYNVSINYLITGEEFQKRWTYPFGKESVGSFLFIAV